MQFTLAGTLYNQTLAGANAYVNDAFNLAAGRLPYPGAACLTGISLVPQFTAPNTVNTGELVGFDGMESNITLNDDIGYSKKTGAEEAKYATYKWNFGDETEVTGVAPGAPSLNSPETSPCEAPWKAPCAASTFHSYQNPGDYNVRLTVTDTGGNEASVTYPITVCSPAPAICPPPPPPPPTTTTTTSAHNHHPPYHKHHHPRRLDTHHHRQAPPPEPGCRRRGPVQVAVKDAERRSGRQLLGQRAGRGPL